VDRSRARRSDAACHSPCSSPLSHDRIPISNTLSSKREDPGIW